MMKKGNQKSDLDSMDYFAGLFPSYGYESDARKPIANQICHVLLYTKFIIAIIFGSILTSFPSYAASTNIWNHYWGDDRENFSVGISTRSDGTFVVASYSRDPSLWTRRTNFVNIVQDQGPSSISIFSTNWANPSSSVNSMGCIYSLAVDSDDNIWVGGIGYRSISGTTRQRNLLRRISPTGATSEYLWASASAIEQGINDIAAQSNIFIYIAGAMHDGGNGYDAYVGKVTNSTIRPSWEVYPNPSYDGDFGRAIVYGEDGYVYDASEHYAGGVRITKYDAAGTRIWQTNCAASLKYAHDLGQDDSFIYAVGNSCTKELDDDCADGVILKVRKENGELAQSWTFGTSSNDVATSIYVGADYFCVAGHTKGNLDGQFNNGKYGVFITYWSKDGVRDTSRTLLLSSAGDNYAKGVLVVGPHTYVSSTVSGPIGGNTLYSYPKCALSKISAAGENPVLEINPASISLTSAASSGHEIAVTANAPWTAVRGAGDAWITITGEDSGTGNGMVTYSVAANAGAARMGAIVVSGGELSRSCTVSQAGGDGTLPGSTGMLRILSSGPTRFLDIQPNGLVVWSNTTPGSSGRIQISSSIVPGWADIHTFTAADRVMNTQLGGMDSAPPGMVFVQGGTLPDIGNGVITLDSFYIGKTEVTWGEWKAVRAEAVARGYDIGDRGLGCADNHPVNTVNWYDLVKWCNLRSEIEGRTPAYTVGGAIYRSGNNTDVAVNTAATGYRLPTDAQWEFAARGGTQSQGYEYSGGNDINAVAWYLDNTAGAACVYWEGRGTWPVGGKSANELGIHDMSGNVWEWCFDWYPGYEGSYRVGRGGSWYRYAGSCRVGGRYGVSPANAYTDFGFRAVLPSGQP